jgi:hypothetical protein
MTQVFKPETSIIVVTTATTDIVRSPVTTNGIAYQSYTIRNRFWRALLLQLLVITLEWVASLDMATDIQIAIMLW